MKNIFLRLAKKISGLFHNPKFRYGSIATAAVFAAAVVLVGANVAMSNLEKSHGLKKDFSFNSITTQSADTERILDEIPYPVHIYALYTKGQEDAPLLDVLDRYSSYTSKVTWEHADAATSPGLVNKFKGVAGDGGVTNDSVIVWCEETDRFKIIQPEDFYSFGFNYETGMYEVANLNYEGEITSAIAFVESESVPRVMVLQGHGELSESESVLLADLWSSNNMEVYYFTLDSAKANLNSSDLLAILSPTRDLMDTELQQIMQFVSSGGSIFFTCDYSDPVENMPNYSSLLRYYGFVPKHGIVVASEDEDRTFYSDNRIALIPYMLSGTLTDEMMAAHTDTLLLPGCRAFEAMDDSDTYLQSEIVLASGYKAYLHSIDDGNTSLEQSDGDEMGPFALSLYSRRTTESGDISKAYISGCSSLFTSAQVSAMTDAQEFALRITNQLSGSKAIQLNIPAKIAMRPQLSAKSTVLGTIILVLLPFAVAAAAFAVLYPRKHK